MTGGARNVEGATMENIAMLGLCFLWGAIIRYQLRFVNFKDQVPALAFDDLRRDGAADRPCHCGAGAQAQPAACNPDGWNGYLLRGL